MKWHRSLLWIPAVAGLLTAGAGIIWVRSNVRMLTSYGFKAAAIDVFQRIERTRWLAVTVASVAVTATIGLTLAFRRWRSPLVTFLKVIVLMIVFFLSLGVAYWPDRGWIEQGWWVHVQKVAQCPPVICGVLALLTFRCTLKNA